METNELIKKMTIEEVKKYLTLINPNNFDEYYAMVLPKSSKYINNNILFRF